MQTFLPDPSFTRCAEVLDRKRLGNQRNESYVILLTITGKQSGWAHHPAILMWTGYTNSLVEYSLAICAEWIRRGYKDNMTRVFEGFFHSGLPSTPPPWLGDPAVHSSHRAALLHKDPIWYSQFGWVEQPAIAYVWPRRIHSPEVPE